MRKSVACLVICLCAFSKTLFAETVTQQLSQNNFLLGIAQLGVVTLEHSNHSQCVRELDDMLMANAKQEPWSTRVFDSFGHAPRSFTWGNYFWFSAKELCDDLNEPFSMTLQRPTLATANYNATSPFTLRFSIIYLRFSSSYYVDWNLPYENFIHLGLCLPQSCAQDTLSLLAQTYFKKEVFAAQRQFDLKLEVAQTKVPIMTWSYFEQTGSIIFIVIFLLVIFCCILAEFWKISADADHMMHKKQKQQETIISSLEIYRIKTYDLWRVIQCFNLRENCAQALEWQTNGKEERNFLSVIAGLRTIICLWVTVFHVYYYSLFAIANANIVFSKLEVFAFQPILQACFYVDVFFVISAFLLVYHFLSNEKQMQQIKNNNWLENLKFFRKTIFQRYMRLTPVLIITMLLGNMVFDLLDISTPFHMGPHSGIYCKRNWWQNLLYVHNLLDMSDICCSWTWYLGCEMQFFILFTALLMLYAKNAQTAKMIFATMAVGFVVTGWLCNYQAGITFHIDNIYSTLNQLYVKPWVRINPYIGGAIFGYVLHHTQQRDLNKQPQSAVKDTNSCWQGKPLIYIFWLLCFLLYALTNFMSYWRSAPVWLVATIMSFGKLVFALCAGAAITLCAHGHGAYFNRLLSARIFMLLNKFCYSIYMVAPLIVFLVFGLRREATIFNEMASGMDFLAVIVLSLGSAFILYILVELPMQRLTKIILQPRKISCFEQQTQLVKTKQSNLV